MKRKLLSIIMCMTLALSVVACGGKAAEETVTEETVEVTEETDEAEEVQESTEEPAEEEAEEKPEKQESLMGYNMIDNGDFAGGLGDWMTYCEGGYGTIEVNADGQLETKITMIGTKEHGVQAYYDGFGLEQGCVYEMSFDAASSVERDVQYRIQINGGDYHAYSLEEIALTPEMQHFNIQFTMEEASDPAPRLCFNMGLVRDTAADIAEHSVYFDNFELYCIDESNRTGAAAGVETPSVRVDQIGYLPADSKVAVFTGDAIGDSFTVVNADGDVVLEGAMTEAKDNANTGEKEATGDFSDVKDAGTYKVIGADGAESYEFVIGDDIYADAFNDTVKMLYMQRCGVELSSDLAGDFAHGVCHNTDAVIFGTSDKIDVSGGWHDAGDYGRYVVSGAKAVADIMLAYESYPGAFGDEVGIPESGNGIPDILDEAKYELDWLFKMQDAASGGVYHKVTCTNFPGIVMPEEETEELVVTEISNCATGDFAAVMAMAARVYKDIDAAYADKCLLAAKDAVAYLESNTDNGEGFKNPTEIVTGEYPDANDSDERLWAYAELFKTTGDNAYGEKATEFADASAGLGWADVGYYGAYAYVTASGADKAFAGEMKTYMENGCKSIADNADADAYGCSITGVFPWGSNMTIANNGMLLLMMDEINGNDTYKEIAKEQMHYLFGNNTTSYCFLTGYGSLSPVGTHHRPSQFLKSTMPGMLVGGPNSNLEDPYAQNVLADAPAAKCYVDNEQSFSCNEVTVYWNSPLIYLMAGAAE